MIECKHVCSVGQSNTNHWVFLILRDVYRGSFLPATSATERQDFYVLTFFQSDVNIR